MMTLAEFWSSDSQDWLVSTDDEHKVAGSAVCTPWVHRESPQFPALPIHKRVFTETRKIDRQGMSDEAK